MITLTKEDKSRIRIFAGTSSEALAEKIVKYLLFSPLQNL